MLEMTLAIGIGLLIAGLVGSVAGTWKEFFVHLIEWILSPKMLLRLSLCILVIALTTTHSRMGNTAFFSVSADRGGDRHRALAARDAQHRGAAGEPGDPGSRDRGELVRGGEAGGAARGHHDAGRAGARGAGCVRGARSSRDYPVFGSGPGRSTWRFPKYRPEKVADFFDYAHNDYAQIAAETGLVGLGLLGLVVVLSLGGGAARAVGAAGSADARDVLRLIMGVTSILIHSWVDFNLQIPANAVYFMVLLALGWISLFLDRRTA